MSDLYLNPGETLILTTNRISVNFIPFDLMLTSLRLILIDSIHDRFSPQVIPLGDIFSVNGGTISTGEPVIKITILDDENDGSLIPIDFIFSQPSSQKRKQERDEWLRTLMERLVEVRQEKVLSGIQPSNEEDGERPRVRRWIAPEILYPMPLVAGPELPAAETENTPPVPESPVARGNTGGALDSAQPPAPEFEGPPAPAAQEETAGESSGSQETLPERTPADEPGSSPEEARPARERENGPVNLPVPNGEVTLPPEENISSAVGSAPWDQDKVLSPIAGVVEVIAPAESPLPLTEKPDEISDEVSRSDTSSELSSSYECSKESRGTENLLTPPVVNWPVIREEPAIRFSDNDTSGESPASPEKTPVVSSDEGLIADTVVESSPDYGQSPEPGSSGQLTAPVEVKWPVIQPEPGPPAPGMERRPDNMNSPGTLSPVTEEQRPAVPDLRPAAGSPDERISPAGPERVPESTEKTDREVPEPRENGPVQACTEILSEGSGSGSLSGPTPYTPVPAPISSPSGWRRNPMIAMGVIIGIILVIAALVLVSLPDSHGDTRSVLPSITPVITVNTSPTVKPVAIPETGVWVRVIYPGYYYGQLGNPGRLQDIGGTGDQFYFIRNSGNLLQADIQKRDNSGDNLTVAVYNNGTQVFNTSIRSPMGMISVLIDPATGKPPVSHP